MLGLGLTSWVFDLIDLIAMRGAEGRRGGMGGIGCLYDGGTEKRHWDVGSTLVNSLIRFVFYN